MIANGRNKNGNENKNENNKMLINDRNIVWRICYIFLKILYKPLRDVLFSWYAIFIWWKREKKKHSIVLF